MATKDQPEWAPGVASVAGSIGFAAMLWLEGQIGKDLTALEASAVDEGSRRKTSTLRY